MKNPAHPGRLVKSMCLDPLDLTVTKGAEVLGVTRPTLSNIINGKAAISPEMAVRLSKAFGSTPEAWLKMQVAYDLAQVEKQAAHIKVKRYRHSVPAH
jgi:addiction module HigA family antidote